MTERMKFGKYIRDTWGTCKEMRRKIDNEGVYYFYEDYTSVPVSWKLYKEFASSSKACYCGGGCEE